jgi:hypothetical protein
VLNHQKDEEIRELKDQVRDLMFYLEAQGKVKSNKLGTAVLFFGLLDPDPDLLIQGRYGSGSGSFFH